MAKKSFHRTDRVASQLRRDLGLIVHAAVREHGLPSVSVSDVEITRDMAHANVYVGDKGPVAVKALKELAPQLRYKLAQAVRMRHVPELHFMYDDSVDKGEKIEALLRELPESDRVAPPESDESENESES